MCTGWEVVWTYVKVVDVGSLVECLLRSWNVVLMGSPPEALLPGHVIEVVLLLFLGARPAPRLGARGADAAASTATVGNKGAEEKAEASRREEERESESGDSDHYLI